MNYIILYSIQQSYSLNTSTHWYNMTHSKLWCAILYHLHVWSVFTQIYTKLPKSLSTAICTQMLINKYLESLYWVSLHFTPNFSLNSLSFTLNSLCFTLNSLSFTLNSLSFAQATFLMWFFGLNDVLGQFLNIWDMNSEKFTQFVAND